MVKSSEYRANMVENDKDKNLNRRHLIENNKNNEEDGDGEGSLGGSSGKIEFRYKDSLSGETRDDLLSPTEVKRLLSVHKEIHKGRVEKQKSKREERAALKERKLTSSQMGNYQQGRGASAYKQHPISNHVQFSGMTDNEVIGLPAQNEADTNPELKEALENRNENKLRNMPKFNPRPRYPGG